MKINVSTEHMKLFEALSSQTRIRILELLAKGPKNIGELAKLLGVSSAITTRHISLMEEAGIIRTENIPGKRGLQKLCHIAVDEIILSFEHQASSREYQVVSIPVGQFAAYEVSPPCGLASTEGYIGVCDDPRYFSDPARVNAALIWFQSGWVEYRIPSYIIYSRPIHSIEISLEICSEFPGYKEDWPSDIYFYLNGILLGTWTSPGDFGKNKGIYTPGWWKAGSQHGFLKTIRITNTETMLDGIVLSDVTLNQLNIQPGKDIPFKIAVPDTARNIGGLNLFGKGFGNYDQNIEVRVEYQIDL